MDFSTFFNKKTLFQFSDFVDPIHPQDAPWFLRLLGCIPGDFRALGTFRSHSTLIYLRKTWFFDAKSIDFSLSGPWASHEQIWLKIPWFSAVCGSSAGNWLLNSTEIIQKRYFWPCKSFLDDPGTSRTCNRCKSLKVHILYKSSNSTCVYLSVFPKLMVE